MDTLTHALSGALLARLLAARTDLPLAASLPVGAAGRWDAPWNPAANTPRPWQYVVVGLVAGAFPDADAVVQLAGELAYLRHHRGVTHSLLLAPLWAWLLAWLAARCFAVTRGVPGGWKAWYAVAFGGIVIHILGDWITGFGTMLLAPFSDHRFALNTTFIIDLVFSGLLVAGLVLAAAAPRARWPAAAGLTAVVAWVGVSWVGQQEAIAAGQAFARDRGLTAAEVQVSPRPASPFNWTVVVSQGDALHIAHLNTRRVQPLVATADDHFIRRFSAPYQPMAQAEWERIDRFGPDPQTQALAREAFERPEFAFYRWFAEKPVLDAVTRGVPGAEGLAVAKGPGAEGAVPPSAGTATAATAEAPTCVWFRDLRFGFPGRGESPFRYGVCLSGEGPARQATVYALDRGDGGARVVAAGATGRSGG